MDQPGSAAYFARLSSALMDQGEELPTVEQVGIEAIDVVRGADCAAVSLRRRRGRLEAVAATSPSATAAEQLQCDLGEGPSLDAVSGEDGVLCHDTRDDPRWPRWTSEVRQLSYRSALSVPLVAGEESLGTLTMYARRPAAFDDQDARLASVYASHGAQAIRTARLVTGLHVAIEGRHLIGVAQGILMARYGIGLERAFGVLGRTANQQRTRIRDVAAQVVREGGLPAATTSASEPRHPDDPPGSG